MWRSCLLALLREEARLLSLNLTASQIENFRREQGNRCQAGMYFDPTEKICKDLLGAGANSTCQVNKSFQCPRKFRDECEPFSRQIDGAKLGFVCSSPKGPQFYIGCFTGLGDKNAYDLECPYDFILDLSHKKGPGCYSREGWNAEHPLLRPAF